MGYTTVTYSNPYLLVNPFSKITEAKDSLVEFGDKLEAFAQTVGYWINPVNWFIEANKFLHWAVSHPETGHYLVSGTIVGIWLIMLGANFPKKYIFWGWIGFWFLKAVVYNN